MDINDFVKHEISTGELSRSDVRWYQFYSDLGINAKDMVTRENVTKAIALLEKQFDLVLITEHFTDSLILFQDLVCWSLEDLTYVINNQRRDKAKSHINQENR